MTHDATPAKVRLTDGLGPLPTSAEDEAIVLARLAKTPAEAYERGYMDGAARERERWAAKCDEVAATLRRDPEEKKQISAHMAEWMADELRA